MIMPQPKTENIFQTSDWNNNIELFTTLFERPGYRVERILSAGHTSPETGWYDQDEHEFILLLQGEAIIEFENDVKISLKPGDFLNIQPHQLHKVAYTSAEPHCIWLAVFGND